MLRAALVLLPTLSLLTVSLAHALPGWLRIVLGLLTALVALQAYQQHWPSASRAITQFQLLDEGRCVYWQCDGVCGEASVGDRLVTPFLIIITLSQPRPRRALVLPADALHAEAHRRLRRQILAC